MQIEIGITVAVVTIFRYRKIYCVNFYNHCKSYAFVSWVKDGKVDTGPLSYIYNKPPCRCPRPLTVSQKFVTARTAIAPARVHSEWQHHLDPYGLDTRVKDTKLQKDDRTDAKYPTPGWISGATTNGICFR